MVSESSIKRRIHGQFVVLSFICRRLIQIETLQHFDKGLSYFSFNLNLSPEQLYNFKELTDKPKSLRKADD